MKRLGISLRERCVCEGVHLPGFLLPELPSHLQLLFPEATSFCLPGSLYHYSSSSLGEGLCQAKAPSQVQVCFC